MYSFIILGLLCCIFRTGNAITCSQCLTVSSTNDEALNLTSVPAASCSESECLEDVTSCMTMTFHIYLQHTGEEVITMTQRQRGCTLPGFIVPTGDVCLDQDQVEAITRTLPDPSSLVPWHLNVTVLGSNISICVCNSSDSCIPPSPVSNVTEPTPGSPRVCIECKEIRSDVDMNFIDTELVSCSDSPGEMVCPVGVSSCMAGIINVAYRLDSGESVTLVDERHACTPEDIASSISSGDYCLDQALVEAYLAVNDPAELYPDADGMTFDRVLNATFCVCDSADHCIPPFPSMMNTDTAPITGDANEGSPRVCIECKEITSDVDMDFIDTELVSCSDSPGEMVCPVGVSSCMAGIINVAYRLESGETVSLMDERHACTPEDIASTISSGDYCLDQALVEAYLAVNDPARLYPDGEGMTFDRVLNATFCVCDSADHCIPPFSSMKNGETGPNTGDANDGGSKNDEVNTEEATGRATDRSAKTFTPKSSTLDLGPTIVLVITSPISAFLISFMELY